MGNNYNDSEQETRQIAPSRREALITGAAMLVTPLLGGGSAADPQAEKFRGTATEWLSYGGDQASSKYSPLHQISEANCNRLKTA